VSEEVIKHKGTCPFCKNELAYSIVDGKKVLETPCTCVAAKAYFKTEASALKPKKKEAFD
jgi:hypothetical protein